MWRGEDSFGEVTCQSLGHGQRVRRRARSGVNVVLLRHLVAQVEQHGVDRAQGVSGTRRTTGRAAEIQGVHGEAKKKPNKIKELH